MRGRRGVLALVAGLAAGFFLTAGAAPERGGEKSARPGRQDGGAVLLPNGWKIAPAGRHMPIGDLPLAMVETPDGRSLVVTNNGMEKPTLTVVALEKEYVRYKVELEHAWLGLAWHPDGKRLYSSGAARDAVFELAEKKGRLAVARTIAIARPGAAGGRKGDQEKGFVGGLAVSPDGKTLFAVHVLGTALAAVDLESGNVLATRGLSAEPYTCLVSRDGTLLYVSLWGGARVLVFDAKTLEPKGEIAVGEHPNAMAFSRDGRRLFVACANTNSVWAIDLERRAATEQISVSLYPNAPAGSTPNALDVSPDGKTLLAANADNNAVAVVDVSRPGDSRVRGFIPTGWYPTGVKFSRDGSKLYVLSGKGLTSQANPRAGHPGIPGPEGQYIGRLLQGALSILPCPGPEALAAHTKTVYSLTPYSDATRLAPAKAEPGSPIPARVGAPSPIRHVFYVIRENRTFDQVLGDLGRGDGDPSLCIFGEDVTPNAHAIARAFVTLDAFFVDAEVSYDGHAFSTAAYATDFIEKMWPTNYAGRGGRYLSEGGGAARNPFGNITTPAGGYIWDACRRAGVGVRSYGEFAKRGPDPEDEHDAGEGDVVATVPGLEGLVNPDYPPYDLKIPDNRRVDVWLEEFRAMDAAGTVPRLSIIRLGNDHTAGTRAGFPTPRAMVAENDLALGRLVEAISRSRAWEKSAIFVLEDDAQSGPDHVDAHRSVAIVASPYARRGVVDGTPYTTSGMLRTIELILGLPPMSQYDASATPMYGAFQAKPVLTPFTHLEARVALDERNAEDAYGAAASADMELAEADLAPELELNRILWKSVRGAASEMPPPVRRARAVLPRGAER